jgi:sulfur carrier protein
MTMSTTTIQVTVNGELRAVHAGATVSELVAELANSGRRIAVERNGEIVPRSRHAVTALEDGDRLEVVVAVGGG